MNVKNHTRRNRLLLVSIIIILIVTLTPGNGKFAGDYIDKIVHFLIFFNLSLNICYKHQNNNNRFKALFLAVLLGLGTEFLQLYIPGRNMEFLDVVADTMGVVLGYFLYNVYKLKVDKTLFKLGA